MAQDNVKVLILPEVSHEKHLDALAKKLQSAGLEGMQVLKNTKQIMGTISQTAMHKIRGIEGVRDVRAERGVSIPSGEAGV